MKIFYCITKSEMGGAQTYLWHLLQYAKGRGDQIIVMANGEGWLADRVRESGFEFVANSYFKNSFNPLNSIRAILETRKAIKRFSPDIVHCNSGAAGFFGRVASLGLRAKVIFTAHGWSFTDGTPLVRKTIARITETIMAPFTDKILCVSHNDARLARKYLFGADKKIEVVHNGVPIPDAVAQVGTHDKIRLFFAGRLTRPKLPAAILAALSELPLRIRNNFFLRIAGDGEQRRDLENFITKNHLQDQVKIGAIPTEKMTDEYLASDLFLLPTEWEGFPMTIVEAMAVGLPVVASAVGGIPEAVDDTVGKLLNRGNEAAELRKIFDTIAGDLEWLKQRGHASRARAIAQFSAETMCTKVWKSYENS